MAFILRSKARGMNQSKNRRKSALSRWKSLCKGPEAGKSLVGTKNKKKRRDFPGGPVVKTRHFQNRGAQVRSLVGGLGSHRPPGVAKK